jgi:hypothetical protein
VLVVLTMLCLVIVLLTLHRTDRELDVGLKPLRVGTRPRQTADRRTEKMYAAALARLNDLEQAIVSIVEADTADLDRRTQDWLDYVCAGLASVLSAGNNAQFRVAIWTDDVDDRDFLKGLAYCGFDRHNPKFEKLPRATTVAGHVVANKQEHYVRNTDEDPIYKPRAHKPTYKSMVATPLGSDEDPWAVMTVDAPSVDGLSEERRLLIRRFGGLASVGARIARGRMTGPTQTTGS